MKKKVLLTILTIVFAISASSMILLMQWSKVEDTCGKCKINDIERKCGKCGGFMNSSNDRITNGWLISTYTCNKCRHSAIYKCK